MSKLLHNFIRGVMQLWFEPYMSNKKQYVLIKNCSCSMSNTTLGVSQDSMLGPVLFILYNDMYRSSNKMRFVHFADDATVFASTNNVHTTVNRELLGVDNWLKSNRLSLNVIKISYDSLQP